jgi:hypothetical protein
MIDVRILKDDIRGKFKSGEIRSFDDAFAAEIVRMKFAEYLNENTIIVKSDYISEWNRFIKDVQHAIKLAAKSTGKNEEECKKLNWKFFEKRSNKAEEEAERKKLAGFSEVILKLKLLEYYF